VFEFKYIYIVVVVGFRFSDCYI